MNKEKLIELKENMEMLQILNAQLDVKKTIFANENSELINKIQYVSSCIEQCKNILKENAEVGFQKDGLKKRLGGIGIRISNVLDYNESDALSWAKLNMPVCIKTILDTKTFETYAKTTSLDFVKNTEKIKKQRYNNIRL